MEIIAHLEPHIGVTATAIGEMRVEHNQWMVFVSSPLMAGRVLVGYLGKHDGAKFCPIMSFVEQPEVARQAILKAIDKAAGRGVVTGIAPVPAEMLDQVEPNDDDDE